MAKMSVSGCQLPFGGGRLPVVARYRRDSLRIGKRRIDRAARAVIEPVERRLMLAADPIVTEFMADNKRTLQDSFGNYSDWIEVYNPDTSPVNLNGYYLATDPLNLTGGWRFPNVSLNAGTYLIVWASGRDLRTPGQELHTDFNLPANGGYLALVKPDGITKTSEYPSDGSLMYPKQFPDIAYGMVTQQSSTSLLSPGASAKAYVPTADIGATWQTVGYNDTSWISGQTGVGFDQIAQGSPPLPSNMFYGQFGPNNTWNLYEVVANGDTWANAYNAAKAKNWNGTAGHLVVVNSDAENSFVQSHINGDSWIGLTDDAAYGGTEYGNTSAKQLPAAGQVPTASQRGAGFVWCDTEPFTYQKWTSGQPNNTSSGVSPANFVRIYKTNGQWSDNAANETFPYVIEYDLRLASLPPSGSAMPRRFQVIEAHAPTGTAINNLTDADNLLDSGTGTIYNYLLPSVNLGTGGQFGSDGVFQGGATSNFAVRVTGSINIPTAGQYTFDVNSDDGFRLTIDGANFTSVTNGSGAGETMTYASPRGPGDTLGVTTLSAGEHFVTLTMYQAGGGVEVEFSAATGAQTSFDASKFHLVGDTGSGGLALVGLTDLIKSDLLSAMYAKNASAYVRVPFTVSGMTGLDTLMLRMKYDDGFVAYINGHEVTRSDSAPATLAWNSTATDKGLDSDALLYENFDISSARQWLNIGTNVLAIQMLNVNPSDPTALVLPKIDAMSNPTFTGQVAYLLTPTPGKINSTGSPNLGPLISEVTRSIAAPSDNDDVVVTARIKKTLGDVGVVTLRYRANFNAEATVTMRDDGLHGDGAAGDGVYGATIWASASTPGQMVRYYITADDTSSREMRYPLIPAADPDPSSTRKWPEYEGFLVNDATVSSTLPILWWWVQNPSAADTRAGTRGSVYYNGEFYDNVYLRSRGGSSTGGTKINFNRGYFFRWDPSAGRVSAIDLNKKGSNTWSYAIDDAWVRPVIAFETFRDAGSPSSATFPMRIQQNGTYFQLRIFIEEPGSDYLQRQGFYGDGELYKTPNSDWGGPNSLTSATYFEKKNPDDNDFSTLQAFLNAIHNSDLTAKQRYLMDNFDVPRFLDYQAATALMEEMDSVQKNYFLYQDTRGIDNPNGTNEWYFLPWDHHLTFGKNYGFSDYNGTEPQINPLFGDSEHPKVDSANAWNYIIDALLDIPAVHQMYLRRLRTVMDQFLGPNSTPYADRYYETRLDELYNQLMGDAQVKAQLGDLKPAFDALKNQYLTVRRDYFYVTQANPSYPYYIGINDPQPDHPTVNFGSIDYNPISGNQQQEYIQLRNPNSYAVDISDWRLSGGVDIEFEPGTVILPNDSIYVAADPYSFRQRTTGPTGGQGLFIVGPYQGHLSTRGETITLSDGAGNLVNTYSYTDSPSANQQYLRITEVMYDPAPAAGIGQPDNDEFEFVELKNTSTTQTLNLNGVNFTDGIDFTFPNMTLAPGQYVLVVKNRAAFESRYGTGLNIAGEYPTKYLNNGGEGIRLADANGEEILDFAYKDSWYPATKHTGHSLVMTNPTAPPEAWGDPANWRPSANVGGSPGADDPDPSTGAPWVHIENVLPENRYTPVDSITIRFSKPISGFDMADLTLTRDGGTTNLLGAGQTLNGDGTTFTLNGLAGITNLAGAYVLTLASASSLIVDSASRALIAGDSDTFHVNTVPLAATITPVSPDPRTTSASPIAIVFNRPVQHFGLPDLKFTRNGGANLLTGFERLVTGDHQTFRLFGLTNLDTPGGQYVLSIDPATSNVTDLAGFPLVSGASENFNVDLTPPTASVTPVSPDPRNSPVSAITITFSEAVNGFDKSDLTLTRDGTAVSLSAATLNSSDNMTWTLGSLSSLTNSPGNYLLTLKSSGTAIVDLVGNAMNTGATESWTTNLSVLTATITPVSPDPRNAPVVSIAISFSGAVTGFERDDLVLSRNATAVAFTDQTLTNPSADGINFILSDLSALTSQAGTYTLTFKPNPGITDGSGNALSNNPTETFVVDLTAPQMTIVAVAPDPRNSAVSSIAINMSEAVTGFGRDDLVLTLNGTPVAWTASQSLTSSDNVHFTLAGLSGLTSAGGDYQLALVASPGINDMAGNALGNNPSEPWTTDTTAPTAAISAVDPDLRLTPVSAITITFSEAVSGFDISDLTLTRDGTAISLGTATLTSADNVTWTLGNLEGITGAAGTYVLALKSSGTGITDLVGNALAGGASESWTNNLIPLTATIAPVAPDPRNAPASSIEIAFNAAVTGFERDDLALSRDGTPVAFDTQTLTSGDSIHWMLSDLTALTGAAGTYTLSFIANPGIIDANNSALSNNPIETFTVDLTPPTMSIVTVAPDPRNTAVDTITINFSEPVSGFDRDDLVLTRGGGTINWTPSQTLTTTDNQHFTLRGLSSATAAAGDYRLGLIGGPGITDPAGNALANNPSERWTTDTTAPTARIIAVSPDPRTDPVSTIDIVFSEPVVGLNWSDLRLTYNGDGNIITMAQTVTTNDGITWTVNNLAALTAPPGNYLLTLSAGNSGIVDDAGNGLAANATEAWTMLADGTPPTMSIEPVTPDPRRASVSSIIIDFSEPVKGLDLTDLLLTRDGNTVAWTAAQTLTSLNQTNWTLSGLSTVTGSAGAYVLTLKNNPGITDMAGNVLANNPIETWSYDLTPPTVSITPVSPDPSPTAVDSIAITFSEPVSGFKLADLSLNRDGNAIALDGGQSLAPSPDQMTWTLSGLGNLTDKLGLYTLAIKSGNAIVDMAGNALANLAVESFAMNTINGDRNGPTDDSIRLAPHPGDPTLMDVYVNGDPVYSVQIANLAQIFVDTGAGNDTLTLDSANRPPVQFRSASGQNTLNVNAGAISFASDAANDVANLQLNVNGGSVSFGSSQHLRGLSLTNSASATLAVSNGVLDLGGLNISGSKLDLNDGDMIVRATDATKNDVLAAVSGWIALARPRWQGGSGITSAAAAKDTQELTGLAAIINEKKDSNGVASTIFDHFNGQAVDINCVLVRYTLNGDMNLDRVVTFDDYFLINTGFLSNGALTGYRNGDLNFDTLVNFDDYYLLNTAFLGQGGVTLPPPLSARALFNAKRPIKAKPAKRVHGAGRHAIRF